MSNQGSFFEYFPITGLAAVVSSVSFKEVLPMLIPLLAVVVDSYFKYKNFKKTKDGREN